MHEVDVLVVGGGPVGLTASILLSRFGVTSLLVERHRSTSIHPKGSAPAHWPSTPSSSTSPRTPRA